MARQKQTQQWMARPRKRSQYWSGMSSDVKGWCIYSRTEGFYLKETGGCAVVRTIGTLEPAHPKKFGPFESFEAAKSAAVLMCDID